MSSPNLDLVRSISEAWERGDFSSAEWADPEVEIVRADGPAPGRWTGPTGLVESTRDWINAWEGAGMAVEGCQELDDERVLVLIRFSGRGKASGVELGQLQTKG